MKILFYATYYYPYISGITSSPKKILGALANKNSITILTIKNEKNLKNRETINKTKIIRLPYLFKLSKGFIAPQTLIYFWEYASKNDLIILNIPNFEGFFLAIIAKILRKKVIAFFHCQVYLKQNIFNQMINYFLNLSIYIQLLLSDVIVGFTQDYVENTSLGKILRKKFVFSLPPIEKKSLDRHYLNKLTQVKQNQIWIGFCGRIAQEKGLENLIQALPELKNKQLRLVFAGPYGKNVVGESNYYLKIKKLLQVNQLPHLFLGCLSDHELSAFYKAIDLLVLPSINSTEAFGLVQAEAMLQGTPVIASNLPGVRIPIQLTKMGIIIKPNDLQALKKAIENILIDKNKYANSDLLKQAKTIFNIQKVYNFYSRLVDRVGRPTRSTNGSGYIRAYLENKPPFMAIIRPQEAALFHRYLALVKSPVLDYGCGDGFFAELVFGKKKINIGLDLKTSRAHEARKNQVYEKVVDYDGKHIPFPDDYFSTIISNCVFEHLPDLDQALKELYRVLKPKGHLLTTVMTKRWNDYLFGSKIIGKNYQGLMQKTQAHINLLSRQQWQDKFKKSGFTVFYQKDYLKNSSASWLDIFHYLSFPSLLSYQLFKRWVVFPKINRWLFTKTVIGILQKQDSSPGAACFYILKK